MKKTSEQMDKIKKAKRVAASKARERLSPGYVHGLLTKGTSLSAANIPVSMLQVKQSQLLLIRACKAIQEGDTAKVEDLKSLHQALKESWSESRQSPKAIRKVPPNRKRRRE